MELVLALPVVAKSLCAKLLPRFSLEDRKFFLFFFFFFKKSSHMVCVKCLHEQDSNPGFHKKKKSGPQIA